MKSNTNSSRFWNTASFGGNADTSSMELLSLGDHLGVCKSPNGPFFALHCLVDSARAFVATRVVTTLVFFTLLIGIVAMAL
jgi:hypothetical protein